MDKIQRVSRVLQKVFWFFLIVQPIFAVIFWFFMRLPNPFGFQTSFNTWPGDLMQDPGFIYRLAGFTIGLIPLTLEMFCLYCLIKLFKLYEQGKIFGYENVKYIRYIALTLIADPILKPFIQIATTFVMTLSNPSGHRMIAITFTNNDVNNLLIAIVILLASWVMTEACKLQEEQALTV